MSVKKNDAMSQDLDILDVVALIESHPEHNLQRGQVGTVVEKLDSDTYEVEFNDDEGHPYALIPFKTEYLLKLRTSPNMPSEDTLDTG